ncbi:acetyltransferase [Vibrio cholerae]|nr:acetyltransferase [Vibrio cholerae]
MEPRWLRLLCLGLVVMRCQPLRRALAIVLFSSKEIKDVKVSIFL